MEQIKVLMIDDDEVIAASTAEYFNMFDVKTEYVTGFDEAERFLETHPVSLLLLDINLGDRSGFDLCRKVREKYDMPILFISARTSDDDVLIALNIGGDDYIKKPFTLSILLAKVKAVLDRYEKAREAAVMAAAGSDTAAGNAGSGLKDPSGDVSDMLKELSQNNVNICAGCFFREQGRKRSRCGHRRGFLTRLSKKQTSKGAQVIF